MASGDRYLKDLVFISHRSDSSLLPFPMALVSSHVHLFSCSSYWKTESVQRGRGMEMEDGGRAGGGVGVV